MKIAIVTPVFPPYLSGISRVAEQEARGLAERGYEVKVVTPWYCQELLENERSEDFKIKRLKSFWKFGNAAWLRGLDSAAAECDIIHLHYPFIGGVRAALKAARLSRAMLVVTYHMDLVGSGWKGLLFKIYTRLTLPKIIKAADKILVSSLDYGRCGDLASYLKEEPEKFVEAPFGVIVENQESGIRNQENEKEKTILFVGALDKAHYFKGVDVLLKAFKELIFNLQSSIFKLVLVGDGDLRPYYEEKAKKLGMGDRVVFAGRVSDEELQKHYQSADVFVLPSIDKSEAYGMVLLEAMANGLPVIASNLPGVRTIVGENQTRGLLVQLEDVQSLTNALKDVLMDEEKQQAMSQRAGAWILAERTVEKEINKLESIYLQFLKS